MVGKELQATKSFKLQLSPDDNARIANLRILGALNLDSWKGYARIGFRTEKASPLNLSNFAVVQKLPLGSEGHAKVEVKATFSLPEPEIVLSTERNEVQGNFLIGVGDVNISIDELNLCLDY
eukprot:CAMPEP_0113940188 /NCGR_PEP_ID=MMETSP1339-20121228/6363_1 /TAXON_ID=94617 /ORGANISM="Fibrocapsa japonica" /LENGTH=121 /DNA_ID=CAMNT_0000943915 /DNA_START=260 /DNA_END=625 /DNA_ORIENTATION=+ /assembly_acc=CAM_ASM_000762